LYCIPKTCIEDVSIKTDIKPGAAEISFVTKINKPLASDIRVYLNNRLTGEYKLNGSDEITGSVLVEEPVLWDMDNPYLYNFKVVLHEEILMKINTGRCLILSMGLVEAKMRQE